MKTIFLIKGSYHHCTHSLRAELSGRSGGGREKVPVAPRRLSCQISAKQREAETSAN